MRRIIAITLVTAACVLLATTAWARVGPPVTVRYNTAPQKAELGQDFSGQLLITAERPGQLTNLRFQSDGWSLLSSSTLADKTIAASEQMTVEFTARPTDADKPLVFAFEFDGMTVEKRLDFSERNFKRTYEAESVAQALDPVYDAARRSLLMTDDVTIGGALPANAKAAIQVHGRFGCYREDSSYHPAQSMRVYVYDQDAGDDDLLGSTFTDHNGYYDLTVDSADSGESYPDLYVRFETSNYRIETKDPTYESFYAWSTGVQTNYTGTEWDVGSLVPGNESSYPAVHLHTHGSRVHWFLSLVGGYDTPAENILWPDGTTGAWHNSAGIHISTDRQWREDTLSHEYGHHWETEFSTIEPFNYCNGICDFGGVCGHCLWCEESGVIAWLEGFANFIADEYTRFVDESYPIAPLYFRSFESLATCDGTVYGDPELTEGFAAAVLRDISDGVSAADDHPQYPGWQDALGAGITGILTIVEEDNPNAPSDFLDKHIARYGGLRNHLWETAMNCGYDRDAALPGNVTNLTSPSHATTGDSTDPTIDYTWTTAYDDVSGIAGYGIFIAGWAGMPSPEVDIAAVNAYTTEILAPGTYYLNLRAVDRAGNWSSTYATYGPVVIRDPDPVDLAYFEMALWDYVTFPSQGADNSLAEAHVTSVLQGDLTTNHLNLRGLNTGEVAVPTGFWVSVNIDDELMTSPYWGALNAGNHFGVADWGNYAVRGGRHCFHTVLDRDDAVAESDETNNVHGRQFVWSGLILSPGIPVVRTAPPSSTAGWEHMSSVNWYNVDGLRLYSGGWWNAVTIRAMDLDENYDVRLHAGSTGSEDGFASSVGWSARSAGLLDAILVNRNTQGYDPFDAGVLNHDGAVGDYVAKHINSQTYDFGDSVTVSLAQDEYLRIMEFNLATADTGHVSITVDIDPSDGPVHANWLPQDFTTGSLLTYMATATTDVTGRARMDLHLTDSGYHALVLYRDPVDGGDGIDLTVEVQPTPADLEPLWYTGWYAPLVPLPDEDGTTTLVAMPDTLHGNMTDTWLNVASVNSGYLPAAPARTEIWLDGEYLSGLSYSTHNPGVNARFNYSFAVSVPGGRHTLSMHLDPANIHEEISETNNLYGRQWIWSPWVVPQNSVVIRNTPPVATAGWADGFGVWYNCDGLRMTNVGMSWWHAAAVMPVSSANNVDVRLHQPGQGAVSGFAGNEAASVWGLGQSDFVLANFNVAEDPPYDIGVLNPYETGGTYVAQMAGSMYLDVDFGAVHGPYTVGNTEILRLHEVNLSPGFYALRLDNVAGDVDWGLSLYPGDVEFLSKSAVIDGGMSWLAGPAGQEGLEFEIIDEAYYLIAVWKVGSDDLYDTGQYTLRMWTGMTPVQDEVLPMVSRLGHASPNPFNPATTIDYELAAAGRVELVIYDLTGARVRTLVSESMSAGRHQAVWNGTDNTGRRMASGTYMASLVTDGQRTGLAKLVLIK